MGCKRLIHPFERVHRTAERFVKFFEWLARTSEWLTQPFERVHRTTERVTKFFKRLTRTGERLTYLFERLIKISEPGSPNDWTAYTKNYRETTALYNRPSSFFWSETSIWIVSTITTVCEHASLFWDCNFSKTTTLIESFFKTRSIALCIRKLEIWPAGNYEYAVKIAWRMILDCSITREPQLFRSFQYKQTEN